MATFTNIPTEKRLLYDIIKKPERDRFDFVGLYLDMDSLGKRMISGNRIAPGYIFESPVEDETRLEFIFHTTATGLRVLATDEKKTLVSLEQAKRKDLNDLLRYQKEQEQSGYGIGSKYPPAFVEKLSSLVPGEILVAPLKMFVCIRNNKKRLILKEVHRNSPIALPILKTFSSYSEERISLDYAPMLQALWNECVERGRESAQITISTMDTAQELINKLVADLGRSDKRIDIGPVSFTVRKNILGEIRWYDDEGRSIDGENVKILIAWLNSAPVITSIERTGSPSGFSDNAVLDLLGEMYRNKDYISAFNTLKAYCKKNHGRITIKLHSYVRDKEKELPRFNAITFTFSENEVTLSYHKDNLLTEPETDPRPATEKDFVEFCEQKYRERYDLIMDSSKQEILQSYPQVANEIADKVAARMAEAKMEKEDMAKGIDISFEQERSDLDEIVESSKSKAEKEDERPWDADLGF